MRRGKDVEHISQERMEGWFRNVHAGQAIALGVRVWSVGRVEIMDGGSGWVDRNVDEDDAEGNTDAGREDDRCP